MKKKKFDFKGFCKYCKDHVVGISFAIGGAVLIGAVGGVWHIKRNTTELPKLSILNGECYEHYCQFGKIYMSGESDLGGMPVFVQGLLESGYFKANDKAYFMITDDMKLIK